MGSLLPMVRNLIELHGPMSIATYMNTLLTSKSAGYYMKKDVFGRSGDFVTAPEISQLFGEMIGLNFIKKLESQDSFDKKIHLIELGPGRGTLMNDILRTFSYFPSIFKNVTKCTLMEISPSLKEIQAKNLTKWTKDLTIEWTEHVEGIRLPKDEIPVVIAQEFFDAIPINVFKKIGGSWKELKVASKMCLVEQSSGLTEILKLSSNFPDISDGQTLELSPSSWSICHHLRKLLSNCKRVEGVIIDYGNFKPASNSLRGIYKHEFCSIFDHIGDADLSADVDFQSIMYYLGPENEYNFMTQGEFLESTGIRKRAEILKNTAEDVDKAVNRLVDDEQMGKIYKVLQFSRK